MISDEIDGDQMMLCVAGMSLYQNCGEIRVVMVSDYVMIVI